MAGILIAFVVALFFIAIKRIAVLGALKKAAHVLFYWNIITTGLAMVIFSILSFGDVSVGQHTLMYGSVGGYTGNTAVILYAIFSMMGILGAYSLYRGIEVNKTNSAYTINGMNAGWGIIVVILTAVFLVR